MNTAWSTRRGPRLLVAAVVAPLLLAGGLGVAAVAELSSNADPVGDVTELGGDPAAVDITSVDVSHTATELVVVTTIAEGPGALGQVDTLIDTDGDPAAEFAQRYRAVGADVESATTTWDDFYPGPVACPLQTDVQHTAGSIVLTATTERSCLGNPDSVRVWTWSAGMAPDSTWRDATAGEPPVEHFEIVWSGQVAADAPTDPPTDDPTDPPTDDPTDPPTTEPPGPASTSIGLRIPRRAVAKGQPVRVRVAVRSDQGTPHGKVVLKHRRKVLRQLSMSSGAQWTRIMRLRPRVYRIRAVYVGNDDYLRSRSRAIRVVVKRR